MCQNLGAGKCTERVHAAMAGMAQSSNYTRTNVRLFPPGAYPTFENGRGAQYLHEYVPLHMPQVEVGIAQAYRSLRSSFSASGPVRVLDVGSGPATVALVFDRLGAQGLVNGKFVVSPVETSSEFCAMIRHAATALWPGTVELKDPKQMNIEQYMGMAHEPYDWIVMANVLSPFAAGRTVEDCCGKIEWLINANKSASGYPPLTIIEGSCSRYINPYEHIQAIARRYNVVCEIGLGYSRPLHRPDILNCGFYRSPMGYCRPRVVMITVRKSRP
mgnify:CR=1 FL=1